MGNIMPNHVLLNNQEHQHIKINNQRNERLGDSTWYAPTFVAEFKTVQAHYPIMFQKDPQTGQFCPVVLFGFKHDENLFLSAGQWNASYIPVSIRRLPFYIGFQQKNDNGVAVKERVITIDMDSPRVNTEHGQSLFLPFGGHTDYLDSIANMLEALHHGMQQNGEFVSLLLKHDLLEPITLDIELNDESKHQLIGFYSIDEDKLAQLSHDAMFELHQARFLEPLYMIVASQAQIRKLVEFKNQQLAQAS